MINSVQINTDEVRWNFGDLLWRIAPLIVPAFIIAYMMSKLMSVPMGVLSLFPIVAMWLLSIGIILFESSEVNFLGGLLLVDACLLVYQTGIYFAFGVVPGFIEVGPLLLVSFAALFRFRGVTKQSVLVYLLWFVANIPALVVHLFDSVNGYGDSISLFCLNVICPLSIYFLIGRILAGGGDVYHIQTIVFWTVMVLCLIPSILIPIELTMRGSSSFASLGVAGRAYSVVGVVLLLWPIIIMNIAQIALLHRLAVLTVLLLLFASSFSRGALLSFSLISMLTLVFKFDKSWTIIKGTLLIVIIFLIVVWICYPEVIDDFFTFWSVRLNVADSNGNALSLSSDSLLGSGRSDIWKMAISLISDRPICGYGLGATPSLVLHMTGGQQSFSGMHSQILTVLVERGIFGLMGLFVICVRMLFLMIKNNKKLNDQFASLSFLMVFFIFSNSTGVELFLNSTRSLNASVSIYIFVLLALLEHGFNGSHKNS